MKKKKSSGGGANWMDTYGDMVTLLLCFFVLLYSMSTISQENWRAIVMSFNPTAVKDPTATTGAGGPDADHDGQDGLVMPEQSDIDQDIEDLFEELVTLASQASQAGVQESISVSKDGGKIYVNFNGRAFFNGNSYDLREDALPVLDSMAEMLSRVAGSLDEVRVVGHTAQQDPDRPNDAAGDRFLASNRATQVVVYFQVHTDDDVLDPAKLISEGMGQWHPVETNETSEGRAANRRVEMIISGRNLEEEAASDIQSYTTSSGENTTSE